MLVLGLFLWAFKSHIGEWMQYKLMNKKEHKVKDLKQRRANKKSSSSENDSGSDKKSQQSDKYD